MFSPGNFISSFNFWYPFENLIYITESHLILSFSNYTKAINLNVPIFSIDLIFFLYYILNFDMQLDQLLDYTLFDWSIC
jgi:hypothetical protein